MPTDYHQGKYCFKLALGMYKGNPESKDHLCIALKQVIQHIFQTWPLSNFHLFPTLTEFLGGRCFKSNEEVNDALQQWLNGMVAEVYDTGIQKLITFSDKYLNVGGNYVEK